MKKSIIISLCLIVFLIKLYPQTQLKAVEIWDKLVIAEDHEKNFLFPTFLEISSKFAFCDCETIFSGWIYKDIPNNDLLFLTGILPFSNQNSLLIWILSSAKENKSWVFTKELDFTGIPAHNLHVEINENQAVSILLDDKKYLDVPDIQIKLLFSKLKECRIDSEKVEISRQIWENLQNLLENKELFDNKFSDFDPLSTIISDDKKVKFCTWNIVSELGEHSFFGGLAINAASKPVVYKLNDERGEIKNLEQQILTPEKWYGSIYYEIIVNKVKNETFYTLIGFNGNDAFTQIKLIDVLTFTEGGNYNPKFGAQIFSDEYKNNRRVIFEYSKKSAMMLRFDTKLKMIVMDNLAPSDPFFQNDFRYYGPDFSHNGMKFEKGKWVYFSDIDLRNPYIFNPERKKSNGKLGVSD
ncbi:MAG: hypothetical protein FWH18_06745 [Marinilabiliaceae bacterium]|nr:hypothetical protein [Marinilabiliaceae bacterium]